MFNNFKFWSEMNDEAKRELSPNLGLREWNNLDPKEKDNVWHYLKHFFNSEEGRFRILISIIDLNENHKYRSYGRNFLVDHSEENAHSDFQNIFLNQNHNVVFELISCFCRAIIRERIDKSLSKYDYKDKTKEEFNKINLEWKFEEFDKFKEEVNDVFEQFGINVFLTRAGFIFRQDKKITEEIYNPVLNFLSDRKWIEVNRELKDAFKDYQEKTKEGYSNSITHAISTLEAFLQLLLYQKTGKGTLDALIKKATTKNIIPNDAFSKQIFHNINSILAQERQKTGNAHPKKEYANEKNARLVLNLVMIFLQACIQEN